MTGLADRVKESLRKRREKVMGGGINSISSPFVRFRNEFIGVEQGSYVCVTSSTKGAKTQFASYVFIYTPLLYAYNHPDQCRVRVFYYPWEETPEDVMERWMCFVLYHLSKGRIHVSRQELRSTRNDRPVDSEVLDMLDSDECQGLLRWFEEHVTFSPSRNVTGVYNECRRYAEEHGTAHYRKEPRKDDLGNESTVDVFDYYEPDDPDEYRIIFCDHVSLITAERGMTLKQGIDKLSEYMVLLRNRYGFSPVVIQQQAFEGESMEARKNNMIRPTISGLADSKYVSRDCNLCLGIFSPFKYELKEYRGYDITKLRDNCRFVEVLVNRGGQPGGTVALYFDGAVCDFRELPRPDDQEGLRVIYRYLAEQRDKRSGSLFFRMARNIKKLFDL